MRKNLREKRSKVESLEKRIKLLESKTVLLEKLEYKIDEMGVNGLLGGSHQGGHFYA